MRETAKRLKSTERETEYLSLRNFAKRLEQPSGSIAAAIAEVLNGELTPRQRQMMQLYYIEQHSMREIADMLEVNPSTVTRTLQVARTKMKACLQYAGALLASERD